MESIPDAFDRNNSDQPAWKYRVIAPGFKYNMTDVAAAIGNHQLRKQKAFRDRREQLARRYDEGLRDLPVRLPAHAPERDRHCWHLYVIRLDEDAPVSRDEFIRQMASAGIGTSAHFIRLHLHPYWRNAYGLTPGAFPEATRAYHAAVTLPLYTRMTDADQDRVIEAIRSILWK